MEHGVQELTTKVHVMLDGTGTTESCRETEQIRCTVDCGGKFDAEHYGDDWKSKG